jgi:hypothetical protein
VWGRVVGGGVLVGFENLLWRGVRLLFGLGRMGVGRVLCSSHLGAGVVALLPCSTVGGH